MRVAAATNGLAFQGWILQTIAEHSDKSIAQQGKLPAATNYDTTARQARNPGSLRPSRLFFATFAVKGFTAKRATDSRRTQRTAQNAKLNTSIVRKPKLERKNSLFNSS